MLAAISNSTSFRAVEKNDSAEAMLGHVRYPEPSARPCRINRMAHGPSAAIAIADRTAEHCALTVAGVGRRNHVVGPALRLMLTKGDWIRPSPT